MLPAGDKRGARKDEAGGGGAEQHAYKSIPAAPPSPEQALEANARTIGGCCSVLGGGGEGAREEETSTNLKTGARQLDKIKGRLQLSIDAEDSGGGWWCAVRLELFQLQYFWVTENGFDEVINLYVDIHVDGVVLLLEQAVDRILGPNLVSTSLSTRGEG